MLGSAMMTVNNDRSSSIGAGSRKSSLRRLAPLIAVGCLSAVVIAIGWHWDLSLATLARHHEVLQNFIAAPEATAIAGYIALYIAAVALSLPVGAYLTVIGGILFGAVL